MIRLIRRVITRLLLDIYCNSWTYTMAMGVLNLLAAAVFGLVASIAKEPAGIVYVEVVSVAFLVAAIVWILTKACVHKIWPWWIKTWYNDVRPSIREYIDSPGDL